MLDKQEKHIRNNNIGRLVLLCSLSALCFAACVSEEEEALEQLGESEELHRDWTNDELDGHDAEANFDGDYEVGRLGQAHCWPHVDDVIPTFARLNQMTEFTVRGSCLPETTTAHIDNCADMEMGDVYFWGRRIKFRCRPSNNATGPQWGVIKDAPGGNVITEFYVTVNP